VRRLLGTHDPTREARANAQLIERLEACDNLMIFGAGQNGRLVLARLRGAGLEPTAFIDDTPAKLGTEVEGVPVVSLGQAAAKTSALAICSIFSPGVDHLSLAARLEAHSVEVIPLFRLLRAIAAESLPFYFLGPTAQLRAAGPDLAWLAEQLIDPASLALLLSQLEFRLGLDHAVLPPWTPRRERPPADWASFTIVDAGAFDGDTLLPLLAEEGGRVARAIALEPDPDTFERLVRNVVAAGPEVTGKTTALRAAVDAASGCRIFRNFGNQGSAFGEEGELVQTVRIDDVMAAHAPGATNLAIKLDVEGAEAAALTGAAETIKRLRPFLAVSAYHRPDDLWALPRLVSGLDGGYRYALRSHGADGADLMLYAVPKA
jgi:FkbM family methyltransferase